MARATERYAAVQQRLAEGKTLAAIRRELSLDHSTVRRFARATSPDELLVKATNRASVLDPFKAYLHQRWAEGCHDIPRLHRELRECGFTGDVQSIRRYFRPFQRPEALGQHRLRGLRFPPACPETSAGGPLDHDEPGAPR
ncbi:hypothetical protein [Streptomyces sp. NPDC056682]|uniref:hypothetical protein n=1 Tax=Streptomyces sp. NPDC056682 TaxID=3345909 RepID=UPI00368BC1EB